MKSVKAYLFLVLTALIIVLHSNQSQADNTYRYFYLYRNSDAYRSSHQEEDVSTEKDQGKDSDFRLYEEERDYYMKGDEEYENEEIYDDKPDGSLSNEDDYYLD